MDTLIATEPLKHKPLPAPRQEMKPARGKNTLRLFVIAAAILAVSCFVVGYLPRQHDRVIAGLDNAELAVLTVTVIRPEPAPPAPTLNLSAELRPYLEAPIYARANGYVKHRFVDIGAVVKKGDPLAELDTPELDQALARAKADTAQFQATMELARSTAARYRDLLKTASVSEQDAAEKEADLASKTATYDSASARQRELSELKGFSLVTAPFDGRITVRNIDTGDLVTAASGHELFRLSDTHTLRIFVRVPQTVAFGIEAGTTADLSLAEIAGKVFTARVTRTSGVIDPASRTLLVELEVDNTGGELFAGSFAQLRLASTPRPGVLTVPGNAIVFRAEGLQLAVVGPDNKIQLRPFRAGRDMGSRVEVLQGVTAEDRVVLNPPDSLTAGTEVRIAAPKNAAKEAK